MEKLVMEFGLVLTCFFFMLMFVIGSQFIWGALLGLAITLFGWMFWED